ncbi:MAG: Rha family transcriptional regulator [Lachnospiraceae bacterium]|nr:Rha family transcriptional regulator [Lachnospiraceae bacterium]
MYELVEVRENDVFTNSKVIAEGTNVKHHAVQQIISKYESDFAEFGQVAFEMRAVKYSKGTNKEKIYLLNEEQATLLMTYMRNSEITRKFKKELVRQFYAMRRFLIEKQSKLWNDTRILNKENRLKETDVIKMLVDYAKAQGSTHSDKLYLIYTKLAKTVISGSRDNISVSDLNNLTLVESIILQTIRIDMSMGMHYKDIYKDCKNRIEQFMDITYLTA